MPTLSRRDLLTWFAIAPTLPRFLVQSAEAAAPDTLPAFDGRVVVVVRLLGGNDGLNTVIPIRDDRYYKARPTIAIPQREAIPLEGGDIGLNPWLTDVRALMDEGHASIVQSVGYARSSRSHVRSTEIWETGSVAPRAPEHGWLGRYLDHACECLPDVPGGVQFSSTLGRTLSSATGRSRSIGHPDLLLEMGPDAFSSPRLRGPRSPRADYLQQMENSLADAARQLHRAARGSGRTYEYPDTSFGQSLRWTGDMIETGCPTRIYYVTIGSFDTPDSVSFDTHIGQVDAHGRLFTDLGRGLRAFTSHMQRTGQLDRVLLLTFSDFGRQLAENRDRGTDHGDASVLFAVGGAVRPGLLGPPADLGHARDGALQPHVDFRQVYADVLTTWLDVDPAAILGEPMEPFSIVTRV